MGGMLTRTGTHDFAPFGAFMILPVRYIIQKGQFKDYVSGLMTGLFTWIYLADCFVFDLLYFIIKEQ